uniref:F-box protein CPR30-like isoform X2 n=1 Tax=Fragaria vesca subsp. vesca TaxID=101020 RepID=UPI0005CA3B20|nr:PREDICTED: F-box protein CPR30-like isoform X2 [Fragaria vesca subsp. vesca]
MSDYLPQEVITNILLRLPIKSLVICTSVCKSWGSMITNSSFIQAHLSHRINFNNLHGTHLLLLHGVSCQNYDDLSRLGYNFMIWNPSIRKSVILPKPGLRYETFGGYNACHGFAFDAIIKDYKVVRIVEEEPRDQTFVEVYSLAAGSWSDSRLVDPQCGINIGSPQAFVNGALHWDAHRFRSSSYRYFILAFDVSSELFREMMLPKSLDPNLASFLSLQLSVSGDGKSLAMFVRDSTRSSFLDIWVMKEYSVQESWTKLYSIYPQDPADSLLRPLCFRKSGEVVLEIYRRRYGEIKTGIELFSLDLVSGQLEPLGISRYHYHTMDPYHESIVLLDRNDAIFC